MIRSVTVSAPVLPALGGVVFCQPILAGRLVAALAGCESSALADQRV